MEDPSKLMLSVGAAVATGVACYYMGFQNGSSIAQHAAPSEGGKPLLFLGSGNASSNNNNANATEKKEAKQGQTSVKKAPVIPPRPDDEAKAKFYDRILAFVKGQDKTYAFADLNSFERHLVHELAESFDIGHTSKESNGKRVLEISREPNSPEQNNRAANNTNSGNPTASKFLEISSSTPVTEDTVKAMIQNQNTLFQLLVEKVLYQSGGNNANSNNAPQGGHGFGSKPFGKDKRGDKGGDKSAADKEKVLQRMDEKLFDSGTDGTKELVSTTDDTNFEVTPPRTEGSFRHAGDSGYVNWNIEWMEYLFASDTTFAQPGANSINDVKGLCLRIANVIKDLQPDVLCVLEGPSTIGKMDLFVTTYLESAYTVLGGLDGMDQRVYFLVRKDGPLKNPKIHEESAKYLQKSWWFDVEGTCDIKEYKFTRIPCPIVCQVTVNGEEKPIYFFGTHTKSKFVAGGAQKWKSKHVSEQLEFIKKSVSNRRRITGELSRLRACMEKIMKVDPNALVVVSGDLNDGPGMDFFEKYYLLHDSLAALVGSPFDDKRVLHSVLLEKAKSDHLYTCVFEDYVDNISQRKTLLDHILVTPSVAKITVQAGVSHDVFVKYSSGRARDQYPSDHRPVYSDFKL